MMNVRKILDTTRRVMRPSVEFDQRSGLYAPYCDYEIALLRFAPQFFNYGAGPWQANQS